MTKKLIMFGLAMLVVPIIASAATFTSGENVTLDKPVEGNVYVAGGTVRQTATVAGDALIAGGNLYLTGATAKDLLAAGGQVDVAGNVGEDLRLAGGNLTLRAPIAGDAVIAGGQVNILPEARIGGDLSVAAGQVFINNQINGDAMIRAGKITLGDQAVINGKLTYYSGEEIVVPAGTRIGSIEYHPISRPMSSQSKAAVFGVAAFSWIILKLLMLFIAAWILSAILSASAPRLVALTTANFWSRMGWGFVTLVVAPVLAVLLFVTVLGIPLGLAVLALYFFLIVIACIFMAVFVGSWLLKWFKKSAVYETDWKAAALGAIALTILGWIPVLGWIAGFLIFLVSFGAINSFVLGWLRGSRLAA